ncbi:protein PSK SIMULATOR 1 [Argentina anserina]|uniref:protein PSK SIMULATOR 1 n=1 Tax=Argentina anserina TaxID=57926 RepID=UPI00217629BA|nr:protein PSK SIMULATOR 1 [Potentilla anserina]
MVAAESWFRSLWRTKKKHEGPEKAVIGVLAFEVASLMSKLVQLWQLLGDKNVNKLREEISNSVGVRKLVSDDDDYIVGLICIELFENMVRVAKSVARLGTNCTDPSLKGFEFAISDLINNGADPYGWQFSWRKMERKAKKMERFISINAHLYEEMEVLSDLEQTVMRMKGSDDLDGVNLLEFQKKVVWKRQEVKNLKDASLWNRTYDYTVLLLARTLFTIFGRIKHVFGIQQMADGESKDSDHVSRGQSVSAILQPSVRPSDNGLPRFASGPLGKFSSTSGPASRKTKTNNFFSGPLGGSSTKSGPLSAKKKDVSFFSGPLVKSTKSGPIAATNRTIRKLWKSHDHSGNNHEKKLPTKPNRMTQVGPFKGCMITANNSPVTNCYVNSDGVRSAIHNVARDTNGEILASSSKPHPTPSIFDSKHKLLDAPPETLGAAALALHYANVVIVIEKLVASPHLIGLDARDDLYNMLPASVRATLRARLKPYSKSLNSAVYDTELAGEWNEAMAGILEWLAPLAHNMIRWQSERSFEQQTLVSRTHVLLVQTLYFANQQKTEATITELLVGLNYIWRFGRENAKALLDCDSNRTYDEFLDMEG